jgi:hypothetical protein
MRLAHEACADDTDADFLHQDLQIYGQVCWPDVSRDIKRKIWSRMRRVEARLKITKSGF